MIMAATLFTIGYQKRSIDEYVRILVDAGIDTLVDVRETAWSHKPGFSKGSMSRKLAEVGILYVHARFAGNPKRLRAGAANHAECLEKFSSYLDESDVVLTEFDGLIVALISEGRRVAITCFERHPDDCHRGILASRWATQGRRVQHLAPDGCERMVTA